MTKYLETTLFFGTTVSALALAAVIGLQEFSASPAVQEAIAAPIIQLEAVEIVAERLPATAQSQAPEQVALVR